MSSDDEQLQREFIEMALTNAYEYGKRDGVEMVAESLRKMLDFPELINDTRSTALDGFRAAVELAESTVELLEEFRES